MKKKIIPYPEQSLRSFLQEQMPVLAQKARAADQLGQEQVVGVSFNPLGWELVRPIVTRATSTSVSFRFPSADGLWAVLHTHPDGSLTPSAQDRWTADQHGFCLGLFSAHGFRLFPNILNLDPRREIVGAFAWCNIRRVIGVGIAKLLNLNNEKMQLVAQKFERQISEIDKLIRSYLEDKKSSGTRTGFVKTIHDWVSNHNEYNIHADSLNLNAHELSHAIEHFLEHNADFRKYPDQAEALAKQLFAEMMNGTTYEDILAGSDQDGVAFANDLLAKITTELKGSSEKPGLLSEISVRMTDLAQAVEQELNIQLPQETRTDKPTGVREVQHDADLDLDHSHSHSHSHFQQEGETHQ